jgi:hypothetical protein
MVIVGVGIRFWESMDIGLYVGHSVAGSYVGLGEINEISLVSFSALDEVGVA